MKKLALITKSVKINVADQGEIGTATFSEKQTTIRFLGIAVYKATIIVS